VLHLLLHALLQQLLLDVDSVAARAYGGQARRPRHRSFYSRAARAAHAARAARAAH
jgi:hypothetical protein